MFVELIDRLRCPVPHEDAWLIATASLTQDRRIVSGALGCPVCRAEYVIADGAVHFGAEADTAGAGGTPPSADAALRLAAQLALQERGGVWAIQGPLAALAHDLLAIAPVELLLLDPPAGWRTAEGISVLRGVGQSGAPDAPRLPLADRSLRGLVFTTPHPALADAPRTLVSHGRLVAPAAVTIPPGVTELARDATQWVAHAEAPASGFIPLRRRPDKGLFEER